MIVVDNDVISYFWLKSPRTDSARRARRMDPDWVAPYLWRSEFRSVLTQHILRAGLSYGDALWIAEKAERDLRGHEYESVTGSVLKLAAETGHSAYDCEYVALAQYLNVPLVTGDHKLQATFPEVALLLEDYVAVNR